MEPTFTVTEDVETVFNGLVFDIDFCIFEHDS